MSSCNKPFVYTMTKIEYFRAVACSVLSPKSSDEDVLSFMLVVHTHCFHVSPTTQLSDAGKHMVLAALSRCTSAEVVASIFPESDKKRHDPVYWHWTFNEK